MKPWLIIIITLVAAAVLTTFGLYVKGPSKMSTPNPESSASPNKFTSAIDAEAGGVEGAIGYPSESIPEGMEVCAENIDTQEITCTVEKIADAKYQSGLGYRLELLPGGYYVYSQLPNNPTKAYYSEYVTCGLLASCTSHQPILVDVYPAKYVSDIDPIDWYAQ